MIDLTKLPDNELLEQVTDDIYFYVELNYPIYLEALIKEEFHYTPQQLAYLKEHIAQ